MTTGIEMWGQRVCNPWHVCAFWCTCGKDWKISNKTQLHFFGKKKKESRVELREWCSISESSISSPFYVQCFIYWCVTAHSCYNFYRGISCDTSTSEAVSFYEWGRILVVMLYFLQNSVIYFTYSNRFNSISHQRSHLLWEEWWNF